MRIADTLGLQVVAEGIENPAQRDLLAGMGCRFGQGYLFARPMTVEDSERVLRREGTGFVPGSGVTERPPTHRSLPVRSRRETRWRTWIICGAPAR
ncbi:hypothetical protein AQJ91_40575 [Streptomyces dysideae]|uniref:EAL domain-containing protein n=1 Tax=Streptomyces dysideae TaxID=909626 RepID=A0A101URL8_9ACTN|nr:hypothetical protein AQJ91_40575 [Streptomyces dysideae]